MSDLEIPADGAMSEPALPPLRLSASLVAQYFRYRCERQLRYEMVPERLRGSDVPARNSDPAQGPRVGPRPGAALLKREGARWERRKLRALIERVGADRVECEGWTEKGHARRLPYERLVARLRDPGSVEVIVQPELRLPDPEAFAARFGLDVARVQLLAAQPDVLRIRRTRRGGILFSIMDIKASGDATVAHYAQIAYYSLILEEICRAEGIRTGSADTRRGWVWARNGRGPRVFALGAFRHHVLEFLSTRLADVALAEPGECAWHLSPACAGCSFFHHCRAEADQSDDLSRVVGVTPLAKHVLRGRGIETVGQLVRSTRRDTYSGCHALEAGSERLRKRAQAVQWGKVFDLDSHTHLLAPREDVRIVATVEGDPVTGRCFALGLRVVGARAVTGAGPAGADEVLLAERGTRHAEGEMFRAWLSRLDALLTGVDRENRERGGAALLTLHLYVWDHAELDLLRGLLQRHLHDVEMQPAIARLLRVVSARGAVPDPEALRTSLGTVMVEAVSALFALPVPYSYDLAAVSERLAPAAGGWVHRPSGDFAWPLSSQVAFERIHNVWRHRPHRTASNVETPEAVREEIRRTVESKLRAVDSVLAAVRERTARGASRRGGDRLQLRKEPFRLGHGEDNLADPTLETLRIFATLESVSEALATRQLHLLPSADRARRWECIRELHLVERCEDGRLIFEFDPEYRDAKFKAGDFNLLLTNDDGHALVDLARKPWERRKLQVELIEFDLRAHPPRVVLAPGRGFAKAEAEGLIDLDRVCVLDRAGSDVNTRRVLATLRALAEGRGDAALIGALLRTGVPEGRQTSWGGSVLVDAVFRDLLAPLATRRGQPVLNPDQEHAWRAVFERPISLVWGPPGTGKTYLLAWMLIGMAAAAQREGRVCRVLVTAATHRAVVNVLTRIAKEIEAAGIPIPLTAVKLRGSGSDADRDLEGLRVDLVEDARLPGLLDSQESGAVVVGSTVWSLWKRLAAGGGADEGEDEEAGVPVRPWFDVVVIDEASQMKVPEALIALAALRPGGQAILCGDHRQLAPVIRGTYGPDAGTLFGSVFSHAAARHPVLPLRESRRMNQALVEYPRELFYPGLVSLRPTHRIEVDPAPEPQDPLDALLGELFLAPHDAVVFCTYTGVRAAARNPFEAQLVARLVRLARRTLRDPVTGGRFADARFVSDALAVISPHRAQNSAILAALREVGLAESEIPVVDTVERMQGNEREMVIVSYAVADREYAEAEAEFLLDPHRFNVSITRPRAKLIVLMSEEILHAVPRDEAVLAASMAVKGYAAHCSDAVREEELPGPEGAVIRVRCRYRRLGG